MTILDSNVWIAYLNTADSQHSKAVDILANTDQKIIIPEYVLLEVCTVLAVRVEKKFANQFIDIATNNANVDVLASSTTFLHNVLEAFREEPHRGLSFVDVALLYLSQSYEIVTFDQKLKKRFLDDVQHPSV